MKLSLEKRQTLTNLWLVGPATLAMVLFIFLPVAIVAVLSFTDYQFGAKTFNWSWLDNYIKLFSSSIGRRAITNTLIYVAVVIPFSVGFGLLVAMGLFRMGSWAPRFSNVLKTVYFLPIASTLVAMSVAWQMLLHPSLGLINQVLVAFGAEPHNWLSDRGLVLYTLSMIGVWSSVGYNMILFLAGLAAIPSELYDAAEVDGAGSSWSRFWTVTWPMLGPTTLFVMVITATNAFRVFETVATMTRGGPAFASDTLVYALYREGFVYFKAGYASAITMVFFAFLLMLTLLQFWVIEKRVHYK
ncbi:carbohydrate ABC transporter permease [Marinomonas foliarum]|jgi:multiple sugar transport system permease protein|uniref:Carbohydrate ABC transporter membrane protein 1 (CUT1 family) n=1 Tax=Marinomonas foliarum TaxID=491950 RepID=A0A369ALM6_9GAMM|nr:sugar ABC transporter permease [Marinomonas foliarum]QRV25630.1 sugar ABC transporter permease [Marinomonas foliarum]RCX08314.1 carbohydrate ABC transporter membrane protein 1 (CUT1 family) [Marinomonas foliarum]